MKMNLLYRILHKPAIGISALVMLFAACSNENKTEGRVAVDLRGKNIVKKTATRIDSWNEVQSIGMYMFAAGTSDVVEGVKNYKYQVLTVDQNGKATFGPSDENAYYPLNGSEVDLAFYYPYSNAVYADYKMDFSLADQSTKKAYDNADILFAKAFKTSQTTGTVLLSMDHVLSNLNMTIVKGTGITNLSGLTVTVKGLGNAGTVNVADGSLTLDASGDIIPYTAVDSNGSIVSKVILCPQAIPQAAAVVEFKLGGDTFIWDISALTFEPGYRYDYTVTIERDGSITATLNSSVEWSDGGSEDIVGVG